MVKEIPILMQPTVVQSTIQGLKTKTRRELSLKKWIINDEPDRYKFHGIDDNGAALFEDLQPEITPWIEPITCPYGKPGDLLWVRETFTPVNVKDGALPWVKLGEHFCYKASPDSYEIEFDGEKFSIPKVYCPSIHMPKRAARVWLEVTDITMERLQSIRKEDAIAEGIYCHGGYKAVNVKLYKDYLHEKDYYSNPIASFMSLWMMINGRESWILNPWVWVVSFKVLSITGKPAKLVKEVSNG